MPFPFSTYDEDPFAPEELIPPEEIPDAMEWESTDTPDPWISDQYARGMLDVPEYWRKPEMLGQGIGRINPSEPHNFPWQDQSDPNEYNLRYKRGIDSEAGQPPQAGLTPPYGTRREPSANPVAQDPNGIHQFIVNSMKQEEYGNMPELARDVNEQADMIRGAAPRMDPNEIMRLLEEQFRGQGHMLPPKPEHYIDPEDEEDVFQGRRFGAVDPTMQNLGYPLPLRGERDYQAMPPDDDDEDDDDVDYDENEYEVPGRRIGTGDKGLDMVQLAMAPRGPFERGDRPGRPSGEGGGGNVVPFPSRKHPNAISGDWRDDFAGFRVFDRFTGQWVGPRYAPNQQMQGQKALEELQKKDPGTIRWGLEPFFKGE